MYKLYITIFRGIFRFDDDVTDSPVNPAVLSPEMVKAMFPLVNAGLTLEEKRLDALL